MIKGMPVKTTSEEVLTDRIEALKQLIPEAFTEGRVDFAKLQAALGELVDDNPERYSFSWAGKRDAIRLLQMPTRATLVPCPAESVDWDSTSNLFIEGDNMEVLKLLLKPYYGRVKMIYIDPPYNTGNDFIYPDNYTDPLETYLQLTGQKDTEGNLLTSNPETSGRYHSAWLSMMYPRLFLARQLLTEDGVIWISIDDIESSNLRLVCNDVFGEENFIASFIWEKRTTRENRRVFSFNHDYILCYAQSKEAFQSSRNLLPLSEDVLERYSNPDNDPRGDWQSVSLNAQAGHATPSQFYAILTPDGREISPPPGRCWSVTQKRLSELIADNRIWFGPTGHNIPRIKVFLSEVKEGLTPHTLWKAEEVGTNDSAKKALIELFSGTVVFETPKPIGLIKRMAHISTDNQDIVLDFFAGSGATAEAIMELNCEEDGGNRRFIVVQLPEPTGDKKYPTIAEIGKERIRRVIARMKKEREGQLALDKPEDLGFKVYKLAESNWRAWAGVEQADGERYAAQMAMFTDPLVEGWQPENVLAEVAFKEAGFGLNCTVEPVKTVSRQKVQKVTDPEKEQSFYICLDDSLDLKNLRPLELKADDLFVCRASALDDAASANLELQCRLRVI